MLILIIRKMKIMKYKVRIIIVIALLATLNVSAKSEKTKVYAYGIGASFNDSTVYFTAVQPIDSAWVDSKTRFLYARPDYSNQLRDYLAAHGAEHRTCIISFALTEKDIQKEYASTRKKYSSQGNFNIKDVSTDDFSFKSVPYIEPITTEAPAQNDKSETKNKGKVQSGKHGTGAHKGLRHRGAIGSGEN